MFDREDKLVKNTIPLIKSLFGDGEEFVKVLEEPKSLFGIPDVIIYNNSSNVIAIEFKLKHWKRALKQAFRYRSFAFESYVFLDEDYINSALNNINEFRHYNIGLCGVTNDNINVYYKPEADEPFSAQLYSKACELLSI